MLQQKSLSQYLWPPQNISVYRWFLSKISSVLFTSNSNTKVEYWNSQKAIKLWVIFKSWCEAQVSARRTPKRQHSFSFHRHKNLSLELDWFRVTNLKCFLACCVLFNPIWRVETRSPFKLDVVLTAIENIATGETSWAITSSHFLNYFHFFDYFHFFNCFHFFDYFPFFFLLFSLL